jgi:hypothetical protein
MEADRKPFELGQGGQASDKVIWRKINVIRYVGKAKLDEGFGGQKNSTHFRKGEGNTIQLYYSQVWGRTAQKCIADE